MRREFPVSSPDVERAVRWADGDRWDPAPSRAASTVLLVRDGDEGIEVFLLRRLRRLTFGGKYAFPGGSVDGADGVVDVPWAGPDAHTWAAQLGTTPEKARAFVCAAVRETFEECGVLLAGSGPTSVLAAVSGPEWERERRLLQSGGTTISEVLRAHDLVLRSDLLRAWSHWTTPLHAPRRFDTRFFLAVLPEGQTARHVPEESDESQWWAAAEMIDRHARGEISLMTPTLVALEEVAAARDTSSLSSTTRRVREVVPAVQRRGDDLVLVADLPDQCRLGGSVSPAEKARR